MSGWVLPPGRSVAQTRHKTGGCSLSVSRKTADKEKIQGHYDLLLCFLHNNFHFNYGLMQLVAEVNKTRIYLQQLWVFENIFLLAV